MASSANPLDIRRAVTQVTEALLEVLDLAYKVRAPEAADLAALAAYELTPNLADRALVYVASEGAVYRWLAASTLPAAPPYVIAPRADLLPAQGNGRFFRTSSAVTLGPAWFRPLHRVRFGYARSVVVYEGQDDEVLERIYGQHPAILVEWLSDELKVRSYQHGALYDATWRFTVHVLAKNLRNGPEAVVGSDVPGDSDDAGPGLFQMLGDVRYLLGGCNLGLAPGVKFTDVTGAARIVETDLAQRRFRAELDVLVRGSVHVVDEDLIANPEIWVERRDAGAPREGFDASNFVAEGLAVGPGLGLVATVSGGVAYLAGQPVVAQALTRAFEPNADTYRDLTADGQLLFTAVVPGTAAPPQAPQTLRVGLTRTDGGSVVADRYLGSFNVPSGANPGDPFRAAP